MLVSRNKLKQYTDHLRGLLKELEITEMSVKKQNLSSFASIISVLLIILYCLGFLRVELELIEHKKRLNALENVATKPSSSPDLSELITNAPGKLYTKKQLKELLLFWGSGLPCFGN